MIKERRDVVAALRALRAEAIAERIGRDSRRAIERIDALDLQGPRWQKIDLAELFGFNQQAYTAVDDRTEAQLRAILTPEQFATLP